jgi:hypothetical protein
MVGALARSGKSCRQSSCVKGKPSRLDVEAAQVTKNSGIMLHLLQMCLAQGEVPGRETKSIPTWNSGGRNVDRAKCKYFHASWGVEIGDEILNSLALDTMNRARQVDLVAWIMNLDCNLSRCVSAQ